MAPLLIAPVRHVRDRSFALRRARSIGLFVAGYAAIWMAAGVMLMALAMAVRTAFSRIVHATGACGSRRARLAVFTAQTALSQSRPRAPELAAFGRAADAARSVSG